MTISVQTLKKVFVGGAIALFMFVAYAPQTHAMSTYYPTSQVQNTSDLIKYLNALIAQLHALQEQQRNLYSYNRYTPNHGVFS